MSHPTLTMTFTVIFTDKFSYAFFDQNFLHTNYFIKLFLSHLH